MQFIFIAVVVLMIFFALKGWVEDHLPLVIAVGLFLVSWYFLGLLRTVILTVALVAILALWLVVDNWRRERNKRKLKQYLETNCLSMGYMDEEKWKNELPQFANRAYPSDFGFGQITHSFAQQAEDSFFVKSKDFSWVDPYTRYLLDNIMGPIYALEKIPNPALEHTHCSPDAKLIFDALSGLVKYKRINGEPVLEKIQLNAEAIRPLLPSQVGKNIPEYYLSSFKLSEKFVESRQITSDSFESEELSLDDLEALV